MSFFTSVLPHKNNLFVRGYHDSGEAFSYQTSGDDIHLRLFVKDPKGTSTFKTLFREPVQEIEFQSFSELQDFKKSFKSSFSIHGDFPFANQYITQKDLAKNSNLSLINIGTLDVETESGITEDAPSGGFPKISNPQHQVIVISIHSSRQDKITCFALTEEKETIPSDKPLEMVYCSSEKELLRRFLTYWKAEKFDCITGWNCLPLNQSLWTNNKIVKIKDSEYQMELFDSWIYHVFPLVKKIPYKITLSNKHEISSSAEHKFPIYYLPKDNFINPSHPELFIQDDLSVSDIMDLSKTNSIYLRQELRKNINPDLTYRKLIMENLDLLIKKGLDIIIRDKEIVQKITKITGESSYTKLKMTDWSVSKIIS